MEALQLVEQAAEMRALRVDRLVGIEAAKAGKRLSPKSQQGLSTETKSD
jgi:hypothetical protein